MNRSRPLRPSAFRVPLDAEGRPRWSTLSPGGPLASRSGLARTGIRSARLSVVTPDGAAVLAPARWRRRASTIPPDVLALVDARDGHHCVRCGRHREVIEHHHRRIKGIGGDTRPHTECACCIISACPWWETPACHPLIHANRAESEAEGLIILRSAEFPWLYSVLVHSRYDAGEQKAWPTCDGRWDTGGPEGAIE